MSYSIHCRPKRQYLATLNIPISECGKLVRVGISEGDTKFFYAMKLVPPKDLGSIVHPGTWLIH
jgi:hypothetical protein